MKNLLISLGIVGAIILGFACLSFVMPDSVKEDYNIIQSYQG